MRLAHVLIVCSVLGCAAAFAGSPSIEPDKPNVLSFAPADARFVRFAIHATSQGQPCIDELEVYGPGDGATNLALASAGAKATASSCLAGYAIHQIANLNDGQYGNSHSWIAGGTEEEWAQIELPRASSVAKVVFSRDREGKFRDRLPTGFEVQLSADGNTWRTVAKVGTAGASSVALPALPAGPLNEDTLVRYAFACEARSVAKLGSEDPLARVLRQMEEMVERFAAQGMDVAQERGQLAEFHRQQTAQEAEPRAGTPAPPEGARELFFSARLAKRRLFLREPSLAEIEKVLFVKRQPYMPSHNYSDIFDAQGGPGGGICILEIPRQNGRLEPGAARLVTLFDSKNGVARDPMANFDATRIYFAYQTTRGDYYHLMSIAPDGSGLTTLTDGPFYDFYPCPLPDGGLAFVSTRCKARFLCWRPQAFVLFRMDANGQNIRPLSHANISEWAPSVMSDGRILWTRSEYLDKGADFGHTLWTIRPDGTYAALLFGNNTRFCYVNAREVPGTDELCCTLISHGGDLNGPIALIKAKGTISDAGAVTNITPDVPPHFHMSWAQRECFRDPVPISRDYILCTHAPDSRFGLYVIDRFGNREALYLDASIGSMCPTPFKPVSTPPVLGTTAEHKDGDEQCGQCVVTDVYQGLEGCVKRGTVKYIRVCQEVRADLLQQPNGEYQKDHPAFEDWYAAPTHKVRGPYGWPSYVAKTSLGVVPVEEDGSASFCAPAGKVLYFEALDANLNELQRMRSVLQLQPGEKRSCVGCHESRVSAPPLRHNGGTGVPPVQAARRAPSRLEPPPWGAVPFSYEKVVQPVWDAKCVRCHDATDKKKFNLSSGLDREKVPASYRTLIQGGWVHYFDYTWGCEHSKAAPLTFGTVKSKLFAVLDAGHYEVKLSAEESHRVKCWIDLNCPLWPDYVYRPLR